MFHLVIPTTRIRTEMLGAGIDHPVTNHRPPGLTTGGKSTQIGTGDGGVLAAGHVTDLAKETETVMTDTEIATVKSVTVSGEDLEAVLRVRRPAATGTSTRRARRIGRATSPISRRKRKMNS